MDYAAYRKAFFSEPRPEPRFGCVGVRGVSVSVEDHAAALEFYATVFGPPAYVEGADIHGWRLGDAWFTLFRSSAGGPSNSDVTLEMTSPLEAERLHAALIAAGAQGEAPSDQIMYAPVRFCMATDPFGLQWIVVAPLE